MDQPPAVWVQTPPRRVLRVVNPIIGRLLISPLASRLPPAMAVLEFTGRRSGRRFSVPVGVHEVRADLVVFSEAGWRANFAGGRSRCAAGACDGTGGPCSSRTPSRWRTP